MRRHDAWTIGMLLGAVAWSAGCGQKPAAPPPKATSAAAVEPASPDPKDLPIPAIPTGIVHVYTSEPGFSVFVDGERARDERFEPLTTPCAVTVARGMRRFIIAKEGFADVHREMIVAEDEDMIVDAEPIGQGDPLASILKAAYLEAPLAEPVPLLALNTTSSEQDPFLTADGLTVWFVSDRPAGRGLYTASRRSPYDEFGAPEYVAVTRSPDDLASPSVRGDLLQVCYSVPEKSRIVSMTRTGLEASFTNPTAIQYSNSDGIWPSSQLLGNGLQVFWTQAAAPDKPLQTMTARRRKLDQEFSGTTASRLPGGHPVLSSDGLRQYAFDGKTLRRARRASLDGPFSELEVISALEPENYIPSPTRRQFFVSEDEQWLIYTDDPSQGGDLYLVRLAKETAWGLPLRGKPIPPLKRPTVPDDPETASKTPERDVPAVDPRSIPLPYAALRTEIRGLMSERKYDDAETRLKDARKDDRLKADAELLAWDLAEVADVKAFWSDLRTVLGKMKPGSAVRIGAAKVDFVRFEDDVIHAKAKTKEVERSIQEMAPIDLAAILEEALGRDNENVQRTIGSFLSYDPQGNEKSAEGRMKRAGASGREFLARIPARLVHLAAQEIGRDNAGAGLVLAEQVLDQFADSDAATQAKQLTEQVYKSVEWTPMGSRKWNVSADGVYTADATKSNGSALRAPKEYENFELRLEWKVSGQLGQGGVFFRWNGQDNPGTTNAFKLHLANDSGSATDMFSTGALFKVESPDDNPSLPEGQWNTLVLRVQGEKVKAMINGKKVLDTTATSKEIPRSGFVCLDGGAGGIAYRKTLLIELPPEPKAKKAATPEAPKAP